MLLASKVSENEVFDPETGHKLCEDGIEVKFCPKCEKWKPLNTFAKNKTAKDGLYVYCKDCMNDDYRNRYYTKKKNTKKVPSKEASLPIKIEIASLDSDKLRESNPIDEILEGLNENIQLLQNKVKMMEREKAEWQKKYNDYKDAVAKGLIVSKHSLTEKEVVEYINTHSIPPRILINAIAKYDPKYVFYCTNTETGLTAQVKITSA